MAPNLERPEKEGGACLGRSSRIDEPTRPRTGLDKPLFLVLDFLCVFLYGGCQWRDIDSLDAFFYLFFPFSCFV